jgi:hypothetical protein
VVVGKPNDMRAFVGRAKGRAAVYAGSPSEGDEPESELCFHSLYPVPREVLAVGYSNHDLLAKQGIDLIVWLRERRLLQRAGADSSGQQHDRYLLDGYCWQLGYWGTKWEPLVTATSFREECAEYHFETADGLPTALVDKVTRDFPKLKFRLDYFFPSFEFAGHALWCAGKRVKEERHDVTVDDSVAWGEDYDPDEETAGSDEDDG